MPQMRTPRRASDLGLFVRFVRCAAQGSIARQERPRQPAGAVCTAAYGEARSGRDFWRQGGAPASCDRIGGDDSSCGENQRVSHVVRAAAADMAKQATYQNRSRVVEPTGAWAVAPPGLPKENWTFTDHVCRVCLGRIMCHKDDGPALFMCSTCEALARGKVEAICGCGMRGQSTKSDLPKPVLAAFQCRPNPDRSMKSPAKFILFFDNEPAKLDES